MKKLIELFNKKYGDTYGVIDDSLCGEDLYKAYKIIKTLCKDDTEVMEMLEEVKLPDPKTATESIEKINIECVADIPDDVATKKYVDDRISNLNIDGNIDLSEYAKIVDVPSKTSQLQNDSNFTANSIADEDITNVSRSFTVNVPSSVLINPEDGYMQGKKIEGGGIVDNAEYNITSFIPVHPGDQIVISHLNRLFWCNASKEKFNQQQQGDTTN